MPKLLPQSQGYCAPILAELDSLFMQKGPSNYETGTLDALLSSANRSGFDIQLYTAQGQKQFYRLVYRNHSDCPDLDAPFCEDLSSLEVCVADETLENDFVEVIINPDDLCGNKVASFKVDVNLQEEVCSYQKSNEIAGKLRRVMDSYSVKFNNYLWAQLNTPYTLHDADADPCAASDTSGFGKGGWIDINNQYNPAGTSLSLTAQSGDGSIFPFFATEWEKLQMANYFTQPAIVVHGMGGLYDFVKFKNDGAFACCNDAGLDPDAVSSLLGFSPFYESRPRANQNAGVTQNSVLMWEPGNHVLVQPDLFNLPDQKIVTDQHERYTFTDPITGLYFHVIRNRAYCDAKIEDTFTVLHFHKLFSKPVNLDQCTPGEINQTLCIEIDRCEATDCDGNPLVAPSGDPGLDVSTIVI